MRILIVVYALSRHVVVAHEHETETGDLNNWASVPVITHWDNVWVYVHAFFMTVGTLVLLPAGKFTPTRIKNAHNH
jgi:hypothetical protein